MDDKTYFVSCPKCAASYADTSDEAEFIGWQGECSACHSHETYHLIDEWTRWVSEELTEGA